MKKIKAIILRTAGTNCDKETAFAFREAGADAELRHVNSLVSRKNALDTYHIMAIPGGFTYGDDVASGKVLANELKCKLREQLADFIDNGKLIIGICNGFQVLVKMGLLPMIKMSRDYPIEATLSLNDSGRFQDRWIYLKNVKGKNKKEKCVWTRDLPGVIHVPIAHAEGKFIPKDDSVLEALKENDQVVFRYTDRSGKASGYPYNPNGSVEDIAGICDPSGRVLGLMPHPERHISYLQHPNWRRSSLEDEHMGIGLKIFENGVKYAQNHL